MGISFGLCNRSIAVSCNGCQSTAAGESEDRMNEFAVLDYVRGGEMQPLFLLVAITVAGFSLWRIILWFREGAVRPDPWDEEVQQGLEREDSQPLCQRCLEPYDRENYFCPCCGAPVGTYTNWLPFPYLFSVGDLLRLGTVGEFKHSRVNAAGFLLLSAAEYSIFAPIYWFLFLRHWKHTPPAAPSAAEPPEERASV